MLLNINKDQYTMNILISLQIYRKYFNYDVVYPVKKNIWLKGNTKVLNI